MVIDGRIILRWRLARAAISLLGLAVLMGFCLDGQEADAKRRAFTHDRDIETSFQWSNFPRWNGGTLVGFLKNFSSAPILYAMDREGRREETLFTLPDAARITLIDVAVSLDGEIAVIGGALTADTRAATFLARIAPDRKHQTVTRTWPYCPVVVTFAADGTIWTIGHLKNDENTSVISYHVLRRFDRSGRMLGSTTLRVRGSRTAETSYLSASRDRVGWFTREREYIEFALDGSEIARYDWPEGAKDREISGVALSEDDDVIAFWKGKSAFFALDRATRTWSAVSLPKEDVPSWAWALGFDGTTLVTTTENGRLSRFNTK